MTGISSNGQKPLTSDAQAIDPSYPIPAATSSCPIALPFWVSSSKMHNIPSSFNPGVRIQAIARDTIARLGRFFPNSFMLSRVLVYQPPPNPQRSSVHPQHYHPSRVSLFRPNIHCRLWQHLRQSPRAGCGAKGVAVPDNAILTLPINTGIYID
jgi:hypothetical protein